jgi:hypothetical protein
MITWLAPALRTPAALPATVTETPPQEVVNPVGLPQLTLGVLPRLEPLMLTNSPGAIALLTMPGVTLLAGPVMNGASPAHGTS